MAEEEEGPAPRLRDDSRWQILCGLPEKEEITVTEIASSSYPDTLATERHWNEFSGVPAPASLGFQYHTFGL